MNLVTMLRARRFEGLRIILSLHTQKSRRQLNRLNIVCVALNQHHFAGTSNGGPSGIVEMTKS